MKRLYYVDGWLESRGCGESWHFVGSKICAEKDIDNFNKVYAREKILNVGFLRRISQKKALMIDDGIFCFNSDFKFWGLFGDYNDFEEVLSDFSLEEISTFKIYEKIPLNYKTKITITPTH